MQVFAMGQGSEPDHQVTNPWVAAAQRVAASQPAAPRDRATSASDRLVIVGAHGGAGATSWAAILGGVDMGTEIPAKPTARVVVVTRASVVGIDAAKKLLSTHRVRVACVLAVPAAPGGLHKLIKNELRVLAGAVPVVTAPWLAGLLIKRPETATAADVAERDLARLRAQLSPTEGEDQ